LKDAAFLAENTIMAKIRIGTCSWKYPSWKGLVYSDGVKNHLSEYARKYDTVEIDQWFWSLFPKGKLKLPEPRTVEEYAASVPKNFRFTVKSPNSITLTHPYTRGRDAPGKPNPHFLSAELTSAFLETLRPLGKLLGPVIFQFEYLNRRKMESQKVFEEQLAAFRGKLPGDQTYAVEIRNGNYLNDRFLEFLMDHGWTLVLLEGYWMPSIAEVWGKWEKRIRGFPIIIFRLHGTDREKMERDTGKEWNRIIRPRDAALAAIAGIVDELRGGKTEIYVNINNHYEGSAPLTIERFLEFLNR
jgi:uncharacterized protein YecE (DUF72 family)